MRKFWTALAAVVSMGLVSAAWGAAPGLTQSGIQGEYLEVRSADVYTGPCFAMSQVGLVGKDAMLAWKIDRGAWQGVDLSGLSVAAVVKAQATLGDPDHDPYPASAVLIVDARANPAQRQALASFAHATAGKLLADVVAIEAAPIDFTATGRQQVRFSAGALARIETRALESCDMICGNEEVFYPPLTRVVQALPAYTLEAAYSGPGLGETWDRRDTRSAFVGTFSYSR